MLLILSLFACAFSFLQWLWRRYVLRRKPPEMNEQDYHRLDDAWGFSGVAVQLAYDEFKTEPGYHKLKNIFVEWNKSDSQRGAKLFGWVVAMLLFIILVQAVLLNA